MFDFEIEKMLLEKYHFPHNKRVTQVEDSPWRTSLLAGTLLADSQAGSLSYPVIQAARSKASRFIGT
jgi:hypothetical protein